MRVLFYLLNPLLLAHSRDEAVLQTMNLVSHLSSLGFKINWKKSLSLPFPAYDGAVMVSVPTEINVRSPGEIPWHRDAIFQAGEAIMNYPVMGEQLGTGR